MGYCSAERKYPMVMKKACPYCGKSNDILIHRWQENRQRMFCPGTDHALLNRKHVPTIEEEKEPEGPSNRDAEYIAQLRRSYNLA